MPPLGVLGQKENPDASPKDPSDRKIIWGFFDFAKSAHFIRPTHKSTSPLRGSWTPRRPQDGPEMSPKEPVDRKIHAMPLFPHYIIRVLGSVAGLGAHAPLRYTYAHT